MASDLLTVVFPTRNRPGNVTRQLKLLAAGGMDCPVIIADSSDEGVGGAVRAAMPNDGRYRAFAPAATLYDKLAETAGLVATPFALVLSDKKITFAHAVDAALGFLRQHDDYVAAQGLVLGYAMRDRDIDVNRVTFFTPSLADDDPLRRYYTLMRRYQPGHFAVFRTEALRVAAAQSLLPAGAIFQEVAFMMALAVQGKIARLTNVFSLHAEEPSSNPLTRNDPFYWFLNDAQTFLWHYLKYRNVARDFVTAGAIAPPGTRLAQLLDVIHAVWLNGNIDGGVLNHAARLLLGDDVMPFPHPRPPVPWRKIDEGDVVCNGAGGRRYLWRREVLQAEPREEIRISTEEMALVAQALDRYFAE